MPALSLPFLGRWLLSNEGRIPRREYWIYVGCVIVLVLTMTLLFPALRLPKIRPVPLSLLLIYPSYCIIAKRMRDVGMNPDVAVVMSVIAAIDAIWMAVGPAVIPLALVAVVRSTWWWITSANTVFFIILGVLPTKTSG